MFSLLLTTLSPVKALIGTLPKSKRRAFVPLADYARAAQEAMPHAEGSLHERLGRPEWCCSWPFPGWESGASESRGTADDFQTERLPDHLRFNIRVTGEDGKRLAESRDLASLQADLGERARKEFMARQAEEWQRDSLREFGDLELPEHVKTRTGHSAWPALVDHHDSVGLRLFDDEAEARAAHQGGVHRLLMFSLADKLKYVARQHRLSPPAALAWTRVGDVASLEAALAERVVHDLAGDAWGIRDGRALAALEAELRPKLVEHCGEAVEQLDAVITRWHEITRRLAEIGPAQPSAEADITSQLDDLVYDGFVADISVKRLADYPRYLDGIDKRLDALEIDPRRDVQRQAEVEPWWQRYLDHLAEHAAYTAELDAYRWLLEEYRIQVFAQQVGTKGKVSAKRLEGAWKAVEASVTA